MAGMDLIKHNFFDTKPNRFNKREMSETTKTIAILFFVVAITNQWLMSYYAADYYLDKPKQQGVNIEAFKTLALNLHDKNIMGVKFSDVEKLIKFDCKK